jgi:hypothetical protein
MKGCHHDPLSFGVWQSSPDRGCQKRRGGAVGVSRAGHRVDLACQNRETLKVGSQHALDRVKCGSQKDTPGSAVGCVLDRRDDCKWVTVTAGEVKGDFVLEDETCGGNSC